uniref:alcohol dehydrogenase n=2 Tax=Zeugodacus cucurbitae TaxID=28588 RepID=A0A0A1XSJ0_ZEUCU
MELKGKNVIYSGGFGGIGQACIKEILNSGAKHMTIFDLVENKEAMIGFKKSYPGATIDFIPFDMRKKETITAAFKTAKAKMGHFDVLVNSCGIMMDSEVDLTIQINLMGLIHSNLAALPYMDKSSGGRGGVIVNISSVACLEPPPLYPIYSASKDGVKAFTRSMADQVYYDRFGVNFITICPGITDTPMSEGFYTRVFF